MRSALKRVLGTLFALALFASQAFAQAISTPMVPSSTGGGGLTIGSPITGTCPNGQVVYSSNGLVGCEAVSGTGTVTSATWTGGIVSIANPTTVPAFTIAGISGGIPYFSGASTWASSGALTAGEIVLGGGAGAAPTPFAFGTANQCLTTNAGATALAWASCGGGGGGSPGGTNGQLQYNNSSAFGGFTLGGDCTFSVPNITCTTLNGQAGPASAIVGISDSQTLTNKSIAGSEINSGTIAMARMPNVWGAPAYISGDVYRNPLATGAQVTSAVGVANSYYCAPFWLSQSTTIKQLWLRIIGTSAGNTSAALEGAVYSNSVEGGAGGAGTTSCGVSGASCNRPGTFIDYASAFATGSAAVVSGTMNNTTDALTGPALIWACVQTFDATATYGALNVTGYSQVGAAIGSPSAAAVLGGNSNYLNGVSTPGTGFGAANWVSFTGSTTWTEQTSTGRGPDMGLGIN